MSFRKEFKFRLTVSEQAEFRHELIVQGMKQLYPARRINSDYFDTLDLRMFNESEEGVLPRKKVRIRWYRDSAKGAIETKFSSEEGRFKTTKPLLSQFRETGKIQSLNDQVYGYLIPTLNVTYVREYFQLEEVRITLDSNIEYLSLRRIVKVKRRESERVIEVKTSIEMPDDFVRKLIPYPTARFSKYCRGVLSCYGEIS
jgi:hypothetical protein